MARRTVHEKKVHNVKQKKIFLQTVTSDINSQLQNTK